jgi:hypothetical protein
VDVDPEFCSPVFSDFHVAESSPCATAGQGGTYMGAFPPGCCCGLYTGGYTGNTNCDTEGKRNLADITKLIDRVYITPEVRLCCEENGDTNGMPPINLADITNLIDHVYVSHTEVAPCL